jgi:hypothetical protein
VAANFKTACQQMLGWIKDRALLREQIISFSINETTNVDGDAMLVLIFRKHADPTMSGSLHEL